MSKLKTDHVTPARIFVDASHTFGSGRNTGVQRVVRNICRFLPEAANETNTTAIRLSRQRFTEAAIRGSTGCVEVCELKANVLRFLPAGYVHCAESICRPQPLRRLRRWLLPAAGHLGAFRPAVSLYVFGQKLRQQRPKTVEFGKGDLLLLPDAYWAKRDIWQAVSHARQRGVFVVSVVYDLIPLTHPQFVSKSGAEAFEGYIRQLAIHSDMIMAISRTVRDQVQDLLPKWCSSSGAACPEVRFFELGAHFSHQPGPVRDHIRTMFSSNASQPPYLVVGTFDPRKNHAFLLDAFEQIWETAPDCKLCMLGNIGGGQCREVLERIAHHPRFGKQLFTVHDATDAELNYCYQQARAVIMPSIVEGFGLPIVEALWHGRQVFASDTAIHREVGGDDCCYFDLSDPAHLVFQILAWERSQAPPLRQGQAQRMGWRECVQMLWQECLDAYVERTVPSQGSCPSKAPPSGLLV